MKSLEIVNFLLAINEEGRMSLDNNIYETIKQDLEVLEILKKYIPKNWSGIQILCSEKENRTEDWKKIDKWLEENEK